MESSGTLDEVIGWSAHHCGADGFHGLVTVLGVVHHGPDPQWALVVGSLVVTSGHDLSIVLVSCPGTCTQVVVSPLDGCVINLSASVTDFISLVEVSEDVAACLLNSLTRANFCFDFGCRDWIVASVELVKELVVILGDSDSL